MNLHSSVEAKSATPAGTLDEHFCERLHLRKFEVGIKTELP